MVTMLEVLTPTWELLFRPITISPPFLRKPTEPFKIILAQIPLIMVVVNIRQLVWPPLEGYWGNEDTWRTVRGLKSSVFTWFSPGPHLKVPVRYTGVANRWAMSVLTPPPADPAILWHRDAQTPPSGLPPYLYPSPYVWEPFISGLVNIPNNCPLIRGGGGAATPLE